MMLMWHILDQFVRSFLWPRIEVGEQIPNVAPTLAMLKEKGQPAGRGSKEKQVRVLEEAYGTAWVVSTYRGDAYIMFRY
jgi:hypothetical protein